MAMPIEITSGDILTPDQLKNHIRIFAGPGAGKTHFLVENVKNIVITHPRVAKSSRRKVLCVTYTNAAVDEIKRRLDRVSASVEVFTIHGFIIEHIIKPFQKDLRDIIRTDFNIDVGDGKPLSSQLEGLGILHGVEKDDIYKFVDGISSEMTELGYSKKQMGDVQVNTQDYLEHRGDNGFKVRLLPSSRISPNHILPIKKYIWSVVRKLTHDEILYFGYRIIEKNSTALYMLRVKFPFVFVDEFQDTNPLQTMLIKLIGEKSTVVGVIGDMAQSIYSFQGAKPSHFDSLNFDGGATLSDYVISGNRRSTANVVNFCNFLRQSDSRVKQKSIRLDANDTAKKAAELKPIHFLIGSGDRVRETIDSVVESGGVVLTRTWAKAFDYIRGVDGEQNRLLRDIYNSYFNTPIDIRAEITNMSNVTWVRAFKFIFSFYSAFNANSFIEALSAFNLYSSIDRRKLNLKIFHQIKTLADETFAVSPDLPCTVSVIETFMKNINSDKYCDLRKFLGEDFMIPIFDEYDLNNGSRLADKLRKLTWETSYKLFTEVFAPQSRYMTVHQAKGLEWDKVIVAVEPSQRNDGITLEEVYSSPQISSETPAEEFVRIYYVACSRAREDLYIHLPSDFNETLIPSAIGDSKAYEIIK